MKLNLGSGQKPAEGYTNIDIHPWEGVDQVVDLDKLPWPWPDGSVEEILAVDSLEHLAPMGRAFGQANIMVVLAEIWRVLMPGGVAKLRIPTTNGPGAWQDPTHVTYWNLNTFLYFSVGSGYARPDWPQFHIYSNEEEHVMWDSRPVTWVQMILVKPGGERDGADGVPADLGPTERTGDGAVVSESGTS